MSHIVLMVVSAAVVGLLGVAHLLLTFRGPKLLPRVAGLKEKMEQTHPVITTQTTMWRAWIGFNASHSMGAVLFGFVYGYLALAHAEFLFSSTPLLLAGLAMLTGYLALGKAYWFSTPLTGISVSLLCYLLSVGLSWV